MACWRTAAAATALLLVLRATRARQVVEEVAVGIEGLGLQLSTRRSGGSIASDFISASSIQDIIIAEAVTFWDVFYYLVVEIKGSERTKVPFQHLRPGIEDQAQVLRTLRRLLLRDPDLADA
ncbi:PIGH [Symbiodinium sp. CCMP2456]|nr:PIGH [Symbiodinium sp. CCMP2456]